MNLFSSLLVVVAVFVAVALLIAVPGRLRRAPRLSASQRRRLARFLPWIARLDTRRRDRLYDRTARVLAEVAFIGAAGHKLTERQRLVIAGQIGLLCLGAQSTEARLPSEIVVHDRYTTDADDDPPSPGVIEDIGEFAAGRAWQATRVHLCWPTIAAALAGGRDNPVVRELASLHDFARPAIDGTDTWGEALEIQQQRIGTSDSSVVSATADTELGEFFGRAAEAFFQRSDALAAAHPELYALLAAWFDMDTARQRPAGHRTPASWYTTTGRSRLG